MAVDIGRVLMELLAAILIQFTPVDLWLENGGATWGDGETRWYLVEPAPYGKDQARFVFRRYDGEVASSDTLTLTARKGKDGVYSWERYQRDSDKAATPFAAPLRDAGGILTTRPEVAPAVWSDPGETAPLVKRSSAVKDGRAVTQLLFSRESVSIVVVLTRDGLLGFSLSMTGRGYEEAEYRVTLEGGA